METLGGLSNDRTCTATPHHQHHCLWLSSCREPCWDVHYWHISSSADCMSTCMNMETRAKLKCMLTGGNSRSGLNELTQKPFDVSSEFSISMVALGDGCVWMFFLCLCVFWMCRSISWDNPWNMTDLLGLALWKLTPIAIWVFFKVHIKPFLINFNDSSSYWNVVSSFLFYFLEEISCFSLYPLNAKLS